MQVRRVTQDDRAWIAEVVVGAFASTRVVSRGRVHENATMLDGFVVENDGRPVGCATARECAAQQLKPEPVALRAAPGAVDERAGSRSESSRHRTGQGRRAPGREVAR